MPSGVERKGIYGLIGNPERLKILEELRTGPKDRGYFINLLHLWPQAVKYHIDILVRGNLVKESWSKEGRRKKIYSLTSQGRKVIGAVSKRREPGEDWLDLFVGEKGRRALSYLGSISDGSWHSLEEARRSLGEEAIEVLRRNDMLEVNGTGSRVRMKEFSLMIDSDWVRSLARKQVSR